MDNDLLKIDDNYNVYIKQESSEISHEESHSFSLLDREQHELFLVNFKKVLNGKLDVKLFEVNFQRQAEGQTDHTQRLLHEGLHIDDIGEWKAGMQRISLKEVEEDTMIEGFKLLRKSCCSRRKIRDPFSQLSKMEKRINLIWPDAENFIISK